MIIEKDRTYFAVKNSIISMLSIFIITFVNFQVKPIILENLGVNSLGLITLFKDVMILLDMLNLGLSGVVGATLYKPIKEKDYGEIHGIMNFYKTFYRVMGLVFIAAAIMVSFTLNLFTDSDNVQIYFLILSASTALTYFFSYIIIIISADQRLYYLNIINISVHVLRVPAYLIILPLFKTMFIYYILEFTINGILLLLFNVIIKLKTKEIWKSEATLSDDNKKSMKRSLKGIVFHKISGFLVDGNNYIYSTLFGGLATTAVYGLYQLLFNTLLNVVYKIAASLAGSIGNLLVGNDDDKIYNVFKEINFVVYWIGGVISIGFFICAQSFVQLWMGVEFTIDIATLVVFSLYLYIRCMRISVEKFKSAKGIFYEDRWFSILVGVLNTVLCLFFGYMYGIFGIMLGNLLSTVLTVAWQKPYVTFKYVFKRKVGDFYLVYLLRLIFLLIVATGLYFISNYIKFDNLLFKLIFNVCV
ncbi:MAG: lipopolysaccharide biosynthesis protein, partial [Oscillospiraceae bacterium]